MSFMRAVSENLRPRTCGIPPACWAPGIARAALETRLGRVGWLVVASCSNACLLLMPVHAAGPPGTLEAAQTMTAPAKGAEEKASPQAVPMEEFLDRLMAAESGGRVDAKNPRSTALGPAEYQGNTSREPTRSHLEVPQRSSGGAGDLPFAQVTKFEPIIN